MLVRACALCIAVLMPFAALYAAPLNTPSFEVGGWLPYWREDEGTAVVKKHLDALTTIHPFGYTVDKNGALHDEMGVRKEPWRSFNAAVQETAVRLIPTVIWHDGAAIHDVLSDPIQRKAHVTDIVRTVEREGFDGIDIDYEAKRAETNPFFTLFLKELYAAIGSKFVYCTIEPRTPPESAFSVVPKNLQYANDYTALRAYCDRVVIMAYDQGTIDLTLNKAARGAPYIPVADVAWVEKVVELALQTLPKDKVIIGIPTYGYEYTITPLQKGYRYDRLGAFNPGYALAIAERLGITPTRTLSGELAVTYIASSSPLYTGASIAAGPSFSKNATVYSLLWWSDAVAIKEKIDLAKKLGVQGVSIFKLDGSHDPKLWDILLGY